MVAIINPLGFLPFGLGSVGNYFLPVGGIKLIKNLYIKSCAYC